MTQFPLDIFAQTRTPFYFYDLNLLQATLTEIKQCASQSHVHVHYAIKANANPEILKIIKENGFGVDCVSGGEVEAALNAGFAADKIVFAGVGKSDWEIELGLDNNISCFNIESAAELDVIQEIAQIKGKTARVALRVNPNVDAHTHHYITTGLAENKFGISLDMLESVIERCMVSPNIELLGLHFHIGSQITEIHPFERLCQRVNELQDKFESQGIKFSSINVGGGLGIDYDNPDENPIPDFKAYFETFEQHLKLRPGQQLHFELGRSIVGQCGSLITKVLYVKEGVAKKFAIVDAGFTELIRPALYQAHHKIENLTSNSTETHKYDVVGPICESSDRFGEAETLPTTSRGDLIALRSAGAYGEIMASQYNCRKLPQSIYAK
ncbi:MAG: diaminopimelate decarboxylase [Muribaculaceae bacterium]|nr:diaminopimelate decarboxylase [Muribaculaceae bacterium]